MKFKAREKRIKIGVAVLLLFSIFLGIFFYIIVQNRKAIEGSTMVFAALPEGTEINSIVENKRSARALQNEDHKKLLKPPYRITTTLKNASGSYSDFILSLNAKGDFFILLAKGFTPEDTITLSLGKNDLYKNIHFDWSGRAELVIPLEGAKDFLTCAKITGPSGPVAFCHTLAGRERG